MSAAESNKKLDEMILAGKSMEAFEQFYAENVQMQENNEPPRVGKPANREFEKNFMANVEQFFGAKLLASAVQGDVSFSEWEVDMQMKGQPRGKMSEVAVRHWKNDQVVFEHFYYKQ